ncbi:STM4015 family protein [Yinghuangia soli]|uniref:STM4015 family protein n=1 Tax=Yinghuangia soli TaxID=2908204 RepID=A0AA41PTP0_9ACTN|nr:STM4015 family protein [Yinghuangia soli]MCF2525683.1 STM4015 family protein [Yinghuangia soli]
MIFENEHLTHFAGLPVADLRPPGSADISLEPGSPLDERRYRPAGERAYGIAPGEYAPDAVAWRLRKRYWGDGDPDIEELFAYFLDSVDTTRVTALVLGLWDDDASDGNPLIDRLAAAADRFPALRHIFAGDVVSEESEISWTALGPLTPLLEAFPLLETLGGRGVETSDDVAALTPVRHAHLRRLALQSGGLSGRVVQAVALSELPALEELDLMLGVPNYGGDATIDDLADILGGARLPALRHLGLLNSEFQDDIAAAVAGAPVTERLTSLDLSMGTLGDEGVEALLAGQPLGHLHKVTIRHHFVGRAMTDRLRAALKGSGTELDMSVPEIGHAWADNARYVEVAE